MIIEDEVIVLKEVKFNENDKILHALSKNNGKIQILARGCRRNKSPLVNMAQIMTYSKCQMYAGRDMYILNGGEIIDNFYNIRSNITAYLYGTYVLELLGYISQENEIEINAFNMTVKLFQLFNSIEDDEKKIENIVSIYELKLISMLGYRPQLKCCISCGKEINNKAHYRFNIKDGGIQCNNCVNINIDGYDISCKNIVLLSNIISSKLDDKKLIDSINDDINFLIKKYLFYHIGRSNFITLKLLNKGDIYG